MSIFDIILERMTINQKEVDQLNAEQKYASAGVVGLSSLIVLPFSILFDILIKRRGD